MKTDITKWQITRAPQNYTIGDDVIEITTQPNTDLWQRTYYRFCNDNLCYTGFSFS